MLFSIIMMFNDDTNDDYYRVDGGWCRDYNNVKGNCDNGCIHCGNKSKADDLCKFPYI